MIRSPVEIQSNGSRTAVEYQSNRTGIVILTTTLVDLRMRSRWFAATRYSPEVSALSLLYYVIKSHIYDKDNLQTELESCGEFVAVSTSKLNQQELVLSWEMTDVVVRGLVSVDRRHTSMLRGWWVVWIQELMSVASKRC